MVSADHIHNEEVFRIHAAIRLFADPADVMDPADAVSPSAFTSSEAAASLIPFPLALRPKGSFTGRSAEVELLRSRLFDTPVQGDHGETELKVCLISGVGGAGKTELAAQFAKEHMRHYSSGVFFLSMDDTAGGTLGMLQALARELRLPDAVTTLMDTTALRDHVHNWLCTRRRWLLLLDNADEPRLFDDDGLIQLLLPPINASGHIILTSRFSEDRCEALQLTAAVSLSQLEATKGMLLLVREAEALPSEAAAEERVQALPDSERAALAWLAGGEGLDGLPLALTAAAGVIKKRKWGFAKYQREYETQDRCKVTWNMLTWNLSFNLLHAESPAAAELLQLFALLAPDAKPLRLLSGGLDSEASVHFGGLHTALLAGELEELVDIVQAYFILYTLYFILYTL